MRAINKKILSIVMACVKLCRIHKSLSDIVSIPLRCSNTLAGGIVEKHRRSKLSSTQEELEEKPVVDAPRDYRFVYPEFLPDPTWYKRDRIRERLERQDMINRRHVISLPEFYVGSVLAATVADPYAPGKKNRFVGICIQRSGTGLRANFTLRNVIDGQGVEIEYELYNPTLQKVEVLLLEKRLDEELFYLRDSPAEYSTFPFDMESIALPPGASVPINTLKVKLGPRPWHERWERKNLQGVQDLGLEERFYERAKHPQIAKPWEKHDLMKSYRETINRDDTQSIMKEIHQQLKRPKGKRESHS